MTAAALRRNLWLFHLYRLLSTSYLFIPVLFLRSRGLSYTQVGLLNTVYSVTVMLFEVPTGALADHFGRRLAMGLGSLLMAAGCLVDYFGQGFFAYALGDGCLALGMTLTSGADSAYLFDLLKDAGQEQDYRRLEGSATAAKLVGTALALVLGGWVARSNIDMTYALSAGVCLLSALIALGFTERPPQDLEAAPKSAWLLPLMLSSLREVRYRPRLRFAIAFSVLIFVLLREGMYLYPIYLEHARFDRFQIGLTLALLTLLAAWSAHRIELIRAVLGERRLLVLLPLLLSVTYLLLGRYFAVGWGVGLLGLQMVVNGIYSPLSKELLNREIKNSGQRATVLSLESMSRRLVFGVAPPVVGAFMDRASLPMGFIVSGLLGLVGCALLFSYGRSHKVRQRVPLGGSVTAPVPAVTVPGTLPPPGAPSSWPANSPRHG